jgi:hypothetical protein
MRTMRKSDVSIGSLDVPDRPMSITELASWIGCSRRFLEVQVERGKLRIRRISPRLVRVMPGDVARWLDQAATEEVQA